MTYWSVRRYRRTKAVRKWVAVTSHPFFGSGFCWPESSSLPLIAHADDGTCIHTRTTRAHLLLIWNSKGTLCETSAIPATVSSTREGVFLALFFSPPLALFPSFSRSRVSRAVAARKSLFFFFFSFFLRTRILENPFAEGTVISNKGFNLYLIYPSKLPRELFSLNCN